MLGRPQGLARLDLSVEGFWRSFAAIVLIVPFMVLARLSQDRMAAAIEQPTGAVEGGALTGAGVAMLCDWVAFPLVFALLARPFGLAAGYVPFIVARNWAAVIISAIAGAVHILHLAGLAPTSFMPVLLLALLALTLRFSYVIARLTLGTPLSLTLPIITLDFLVSFTIWGVFERIAYPAG